MLFLYTLKNWLQSCPSDVKPHYYRRYIDDIFVLFTSPEHLEALRNFLNGRHANVLHLKMKSKTEYPFLMYRLFVKIKYLPLLSTINITLVEFINILTAFYHLPISFVLFTHTLVDPSEDAQVGLNCTLN